MRFNLQEYNTFNISVLCEKAVRINSEQRLVEAIEKDANEKIIVGCGSNILFTKDITDTVLINEIIGKQIIEEGDDYVLVRFGGGELWHECVEWAIENDFGGIENLALIPGTIGAAPMQNIGAYGVELSDVFHSLEAYDLIFAEKRIFTKEECQFGYRDSIFKNELKNQYFISKVTLKLSVGHHELKLDYGDIRQQLEVNEVEDLDIADVAEAVMMIRETKLPYPEDIPNAGSFFKNIEMEKEDFAKILAEHPDIKYFENKKNDKIKIPAAWLIDQCGWKGHRSGDAGVHENHALVLVNHGKATGGEIWGLAKKIQKDVKAKFGITLQPEVNVY
jgi:UDP-N-acetylmuramate dehydrogenase